MLCLLVLTLGVTPPTGLAQNDQAIENNAPVVLDSRTLFTLPSESRAESVSEQITKIANDETITLDRLRLENEESETDFYAGNQLIFTLTDADIQGTGKARETLATEYLLSIQNAIKTYRQVRSSEYLIRYGVQAAIATIIFILIIWLLNSSFKKRIIRKIDQLAEEEKWAIRWQGETLVNQERCLFWTWKGIKLFKQIILLLLVLLHLNLLLLFFPWTAYLSQQLWGALGNAILPAGGAILRTLPRLLVVLLTIGITAVLWRLLRRIRQRLEDGRITLEKFPADLARPTYYLLTGGLILIAVAIAFPFIPILNSPTVAALLGVILILGIIGSWDAIQNLIAGIMILYSRAFTVGDRIKIGDIEGIVFDRNGLITRLRNSNNEVIALPHRRFLREEVVNYTASLRERKIPLLLHTQILIPYHTPWRLVHKTLLHAAQKTRYILPDPKSFVLQKQLTDTAILYELNAYTNAPALMEKVYGELHQNIVDRCNEVGIELVSPQYSAVRDGNMAALPPNYLPDDYTASGFRVSAIKADIVPSNVQKKSSHPKGKES
ncbi:mechanosensitive ion channel family protein [Spirulina sp. CS-785/01]|uniref:mechanosensitive ion channel family protein n=1 Tax=Spirulina sp. CS-785/01 TaxID=3021716 RepID=UPI00232FF5C3|nr:mechanosensitive ion channel family protein [Spirulina sp. CS-785/01]MDB9315080.1 mechanosensitive ion channel family protein [Spirulina sp. CS-785/01]